MLQHSQGLLAGRLSSSLEYIRQPLRGYSQFLGQNDLFRIGGLQPRLDILDQAFGSSGRHAKTSTFWI